MRILFLTQYFPPEMGAAQNRIGYFAKYFATSGHSVTVLTAMPNYPQGEIFDRYRGKWISEEHVGSMRILRAWVHATKSKAFLRRLLNYFSFVLSSVFLGLWKAGKQDILIVESPPLFLGLSGLLLKTVKRAKFAFNVSDLWPESAVALGVVRNRLVIQAATRLEEWMYRSSDLITGQTRGIVRNIQERIADKPVELITNGTEILREAAGGAELAERKRKWGWQDTFIVGYAGLHGLVYGLETVIETAQILSSHRDITFVLFGDGPDKDRLVSLAEQRELTNMKFYPSQPTARILDIISCFDLALVPLRKLELLQGTLPSKMFEAMGMGVPIVASVSGEAQVVVEESGGGICVAPEDAQRIAEAILRLHKDPSLRSSMGAKGKEYVMQNYNRVDIARRYEQLLQETGGRNADLSDLVGVRGRKSRREYTQAD